MAEPVEAGVLDQPDPSTERSASSVESLRVRQFYKGLMEITLFILRMISALSLLSFVGALGWMIYRDMRLTSQLLENPEDDRAGLILISSESKLYTQGTRFALRPVTGIGRGAGNTIVIADDFASGEHALVARRGSQWWLEDLDSSNGTLLNGAELGRPTVITAGDVITIGSTELRLDL